MRAVAEKPHEATVKFDACRNVQRRRAVLPAISQHLFKYRIGCDASSSKVFIFFVHNITVTDIVIKYITNCQQTKWKQSSYINLHLGLLTYLLTHKWYWCKLYVYAMFSVLAYCTGLCVDLNMHSAYRTVINVLKWLTLSYRSAFGLGGVGSCWVKKFGPIISVYDALSTICGKICMIASLHFSANCMHWLRAPESERIQFKLALLVYKCLRETIPSYLADELEYTADVNARRRLPHCRWMLVVYVVVHRWRSGLPCCCCPYLEQSAPTFYVHALYACFPRSPQGFPPLAFFPVTFSPTAT